MAEIEAWRRDIFQQHSLLKNNFKQFYDLHGVIHPDLNYSK